MRCSCKINGHEMGCLGAGLILLAYLAVPVFLIYATIIGIIEILI